jgi:hypothetical protein
MLAVTGVLLNHTERLALDEVYVKSEPVLDWYGVRAPDIDGAFNTASHWIVEIEDQLYMDRRALEPPATGMRGAIEIKGLIVVATQGTVLLLTAQGELVEQLGDAEGVPSGLSAIGRARDGQVVVDAAHGRYTTDAGFLSWRHYSGDKPIRWSRPLPPPPALTRDLQHRYRSHILPVERVMLDVHSGRILGTLGIFVVDAAAVLLCFLGVSGSWLWYERYRKRKAHLKARSLN